MAVRSKTLALVGFAVEEGAEDQTELVFKVKGPVKLLPDIVSHKAAGKGMREVRVGETAKKALFKMGEVIDVTKGTIESDEDDDAYLDWWRDNFVLESLGGGYDPEEAEEVEVEEEEEEEEVEEEEEEVEEEEEEVEEAFDLDAWDASPETWTDAAEALAAMKASDVKTYAKGMNVKPASSKAKTIEAIEAHVRRYEVAGKTATTAKAFITANAEDEDELSALLNAENARTKPRSSVVKAIDAAISALSEPEPEEEEEEEAPPPVKAKGKAPPKKAKAPAKAKASKAKGKTPPKKTRKKVVEEDEHADEIEALMQAIGPQVAGLVRTIGSKRTRTELTRLVGRIDPDTGAIGDKDGKGETGGTFPLFFVPGRTLSASKRHKGDWGTCEYDVLCRKDGQFEIVSVTGNRSDLKPIMNAKGKKAKKNVFKTGKALLQALTGKDNPGTMVYRWFGLEG